MVALKNIIKDFYPFFWFIAIAIFAMSLYGYYLSMLGLIKISLVGGEESVSRLSLKINGASLICGVLAFVVIGKLNKGMARDERREEGRWKNTKVEKVVKKFYWLFFFPLQAVVMTCAFGGVASFGGFVNSLITYYTEAMPPRTDLLLILGVCVVFGAIAWYPLKRINDLY